jgi:hypothetical protein
MATRVPEEDAEQLPPAEAARARRRDHDAAAGARSGMRSGLAKQFKQVLDAQAKRARAADTPRADEVPADEEAATEPPPKKRGHHGRRTAPHR